MWKLLHGDGSGIYVCDRNYQGVNYRMRKSPWTSSRAGRRKESSGGHTKEADSKVVQKKRVMLWQLKKDTISGWNSTGDYWRQLTCCSRWEQSIQTVLKFAQYVKQGLWQQHLQGRGGSTELVGERQVFFVPDVFREVGNEREERKGHGIQERKTNVLRWKNVLKWEYFKRKDIEWYLHYENKKTEGVRGQGEERTRGREHL